MWIVVVVRIWVRGRGSVVMGVGLWIDTSGEARERYGSCDKSGDETDEQQAGG